MDHGHSHHQGLRRTMGRASAELASGVGALVLAGAGPLRAQQAPTAAPLVFEGVTVVDVEQGKLVPGQRVVIVGNRIRTVGGMRAVKKPKGAQVVEAHGKYLIPGLWDLHVHPNRRATNFFYPLFLANGVTGFRDAGSAVPLDSMILWRREILAGQRVGPPRQILSGKYISEEGRNGTQKPCIRSQEKTQQTCVSPTLADMRHLVDSLKAAGADMIKPYNLSREMYFVLAAEARRAGIPFGGHVYPRATTLVEASDSGARIIDHNSIPPIEKLCLKPTASIAQCQPVAERYQRNGTWWVPTMMISMVSRSNHGERTRPILAHFCRRTEAFWAGGTLLPGNWLGDAAVAEPSRAPGADSRPQPPSDSSADTLGYLRIPRQVGMPILAGTDVADLWMQSETPGFALHAELAIYAAEGLTPLQALQTATLNPAKMLRGTDSLGTVAAGKLADLVLLDANPLADITNTTTIRAVVANGRYFDRAALDQVLTEVRARAPVAYKPDCSKIDAAGKP